MKTELKDVIHFYLGCKAQLKRSNDRQYHIGTICEVTKGSNHGNWVEARFEDVFTTTSFEHEQSTSNQHHYFIGDDSIKPILRQLSDITKEEKEQFTKLPMYPDVPGLWNISRQRAEETLLLTKLGFDVFGLIESGQAIDSTTVTP